MIGQESIRNNFSSYMESSTVLQRHKVAILKSKVKPELNNGQLTQIQGTFEAQETEIIKEMTQELPKDHLEQIQKRTQARRVAREISRTEPSYYTQKSPVLVWSKLRSMKCQTLYINCSNENY